MNLVAGATGYLGGEICRLLAAQGRAVRALVREGSDPSAVERLRRLDVRVVQGDLKDRATLDAACRGATAIISTATTVRSRQNGDTIESVDRQGQINLVDAARAAGVPRFVYVSYSGNYDTDSPLTAAKRAVEQHLQRSGLTYTILRPSYFMEVWLGPPLGFDIAGAKVTIAGAGENRISWISLGDVARFAVECLDHPAARNAVVELGGPDALSPLEVVRICEDLSGRTFEVQRVPEAALRSQHAAATDSLQRSFYALQLDYARGDPIDMQRTLQTFPIRLASVRDYAARVLGR